MNIVRSRFASLVAVLALLAAPIALVALTAAPAGAVDVTTEAEYLDAFNDAGDVEINLLNDITFTCPASASRAVAAGETVTVHGNGHTIHACPTVTGHSISGGNAVFDNVILDGGIFIVSMSSPSGDLTFTNSQLTSGDVSAAISAAIANLRVSGSQVGPLAGTSVTGVSLSASTLIVDGGSTIGPITSTGSATGISAAAETTISDSLVTSIQSPSISPALSIAAPEISIVRSTITETGGSSMATDQLTVENSTVSNNEGPMTFSADSASFVYSDILENGGSFGPAAAPAELPPDAPEGLVLPDLSALDDIAPAQVPAQLVFQADASFFGTVVALPAGGVQNCDLVDGAITSNGYNFSDDDSCNLIEATDQEDAGDPGVGPLADNGGPTPTRLPLAGSPLINAIPLDACQDDGAAGITIDQRGLPRPAETGCEIGSVEIQPPPVPEPVVLVPTFTG